MRKPLVQADWMPEMPRLGRRELETIIRLVYEKSGIALHEGKRALIASRLHKRLKATGAASVGDYLRRLEADPSGQELVALLDAMTTNHTSFFREPQHFAFLAERVVPELLARRHDAAIEVWSAACATGEEPYTLAIALLEAVPPSAAGRIRVLASDLSTRALRIAREGVYKIEKVQPVPPAFLKRYFERGLGAQTGLARVRPEVRRLVEFRPLNLLEITSLGRQFPVIFCRNVLIYFDRAAQQRVVTMLERHLVEGGYLFVSHAESLNGLAHGLECVAPAVYRRRGA
jgi:chemotaxis protein methyltransferase CheR